MTKIWVWAKLRPKPFCPHIVLETVPPHEQLRTVASTSDSYMYVVPTYHYTYERASEVQGRPIRSSRELLDVRARIDFQLASHQWFFDITTSNCTDWLEENKVTLQTHNIRELIMDVAMVPAVGSRVLSPANGPTFKNALTPYREPPNLKMIRKPFLIRFVYLYEANPTYSFMYHHPLRSTHLLAVILWTLGAVRR